MIEFLEIDKRRLYVLICVYFAAIVNLLSDTINSIALYIVLPSAFVVTFLDVKRIFIAKYFNLLTCLYIWILISVIWATDLDVAFSHLKQCLGAFILSYIISVKARDFRNIELLYLLYVLILVMYWYYAYTNIFDKIDLGVERINDRKLNANSFAYHTFYATFAVYILGEIYQNRKYIYNMLFIFMIPLSFYTAIYTASRQILIIQIPFISILLYIRYLKNNTIKQKIQFSVVFILILLMVSPQISSIYNNSYLKERNELTIEDDSRSLLVKDAFNVGVEYFPLGVGPGNYIVHSYSKHFSHNTYTELFANEGIIGLLIYLILILSFVKTQWERYCFYLDDIFLAFFYFGLFFIVDGFFYSFYEHLWLISFFILIAIHSDTYYEYFLIE